MLHNKSIDGFLVDRNTFHYFTRRTKEEKYKALAQRILDIGIIKTEQTHLGLDGIHPPHQWSHLRKLGTANDMVAPMIFKNVLTFSIMFESQADATFFIFGWVSEELNLPISHFPTSSASRGSDISINLATIGFSGFQTPDPLSRRRMCYPLCHTNCDEGDWYNVI